MALMIMMVMIITCLLTKGLKPYFYVRPLLDVFTIVTSDMLYAEIEHVQILS